MKKNRAFMLVIYGGEMLQRVQFLNYPNAFWSAMVSTTKAEIVMLRKQGTKGLKNSQRKTTLRVVKAGQKQKMGDMEEMNEYVP